ncbi:MAG: TlpA family protein disulfide reductase [Fimbriimonadales bacterium]|nr:TlpA family protein disulfide reductase [Fimbriimonadales bacterium]
MQRGLGIVGLLCVFMCCAVAQDAAVQSHEKPLLTVQVVDERNNPIAGATVGLLGVIRRENRVDTWPITDDPWLSSDATGKASFAPSKNLSDEELQEFQEWMVIVSAPGYLPVREIIRRPESGSTHIARLKQGRPLEIILRNETGKAMPEKPSVAVFQADEPNIANDYMEWTPARDKMSRLRIHSQFGLEHRGEGRVVCSVPEEPPSLLLLVYHPGFLRGYWTVIDAATVKQGRAEVRLPQTCTLQIQVDVSQSPKDWIPDFDIDLKAQVRVVRASEAGRGISLYDPIAQIPAGERTQMTLDDLAPGDYWVGFSGFPPRELLRAPNRELSGFFFQEDMRVEAKPDTPAQLSLVYTHPNPKNYQGDRSVSLTVRTPRGAPAANQPYAVYVMENEMRLRLASGTLDGEGRATITQLKPDVEYTLMIGEGERATEQPLQITDAESNASLVVMLPPYEGDPAPDTPLYTLNEKSQKSLSAYRGKWLYVDFWATWCGPCRTALQELKEKLPAIREQWKDDLMLVTISFDQSPDDAKAFLERLGLWEAGVHLWAGEDAIAGAAFGVQFIPTVFIIDPNGVVVWRGFPQDLNLSVIWEQAQSRKPSP